MENKGCHEQSGEIIKNGDAGVACQRAKGDEPQVFHRLRKKALYRASKRGVRAKQVTDFMWKKIMNSVCANYYTWLYNDLTKPLSLLDLVEGEVGKSSGLCGGNDR